MLCDVPNNDRARLDHLVLDNKKYLGAVFELDNEVVGFDSIPECIDLCRYYLEHDEERRQIAAKGWRRVTTDYNELAVFDRTLSLVRESMAARQTRSTQERIAVRQFQNTRQQRAWDTLLHWTKRIVPGSLQPAIHKILFLSLFKSLLAGRKA